MKQKKKAGVSDRMGLVLMGVKKAFDKTKDSKDVRKDRGKCQKIQNSLKDR
ncbi:hypothetical protein AGMMS50222_05360 [Endomicrobiia bacterium]|nr:hypothetical protein AGMMS49531_06100 [Endomicrobiia bacterium]GHT65317.1 hypothetical protein AGMMS49556_04950 [Endomicrobiia bacterium]GHT71037.1 hypothetical protein AGMMS49950_06990 [Endomicrobiia bacterium]GHT75072.1 hypothetical protein AGMMS50222_05360 [Endomicrobiia bacterium]